jgi:hypothetical protein
VLHRYDTITDFNYGEGDKLDLSALIQNQSWVEVSGPEQALVSGVIYFEEREKNGTFSTDVWFDYNGALNGHDAYDDSSHIAHLAGVRASTIPLDFLIV